MAEIDFDEFEDAVYAPARDPARMAQMNRLLNYAGAASSVVLVALIGMWGYNLAMRDANGVPVMKAISGPMRVPPADPGGKEASNQGLSVNTVAAASTAPPAPKVLKLAPPPTGVTAQDKPGMGETVASKPAAPATAAPSEVPPAKPAPLADPAAAFTAAAVDSATISGNGVSKAASTHVGSGLSTSLVPPLRPASLAPATAAGPSMTDPATLPVGTQMVQLGAFPSVDQAEVKWVSLSAAFGEIMQGKSMVVETAEAGGKPFYRLRAVGFDNAADARRFCTLLAAGNSDCVPVTKR